ncbi:YciI family protein [Sinomonas atrocyanea]
MTRFLITYHGMPYPEREVIEPLRRALRDWTEKSLGSALVDFGTPLLLGGQLSDGQATDAVQIDGYTIIEARDLADARALLADHPYLARGGTIQINECVEV